MKHTTDAAAYQFGDWQVEPRLNRLVRDGQLVDLEPRSMAVLHHLLARHNEVVTLDELLEHVWLGQVVELGSVQRHITRLRHVLDDDPKNPRYIETIKKRGYRAIATLRKSTQAAPQQASSNTSIAVLPFDNLSPDPDNAYFAAGIHEELLTRLAKIRALRVISRTSVMEYAAQPTNICAIGKALGVAHILEGSIRRAFETVRISVQLIDASTDDHLWAETYERALTAENVFAIQSDIATAIAQRLCGTLSSGDTISDVPTQHTQAYECYLSGNELFRLPDSEQNLPSALQAYQRALELDPQFALAHACLAHVHSRCYWVGLDRTEQRLALARAAFERAFELVPGLPEAHLAAGQYYYRGLDDYQRALDEYALAEAKLGSTAEMAMAHAEIYRRMGNWQESLDRWQEAVDLDPRNALPLFQYSSTCMLRRDYVNAARSREQAQILQQNPGYDLISIDLLRDGNTAGMDEFPMYSWLVALYDRDYTAQLDYLDNFGPEPYSSMFTYVSRASLYGLTYQLLDDQAAAATWFQKAYDEAFELYLTNKRDPHICIAVGEALAGLGESRAATEFAEQAIALRPTARDAMTGPAVQIDAVMRVLLRAGAYARALKELQAYLASPGLWSLEGLLPDPRLDPLRDTPEFRALIHRFKRC